MSVCYFVPAVASPAWAVPRILVLCAAMSSPGQLAAQQVMLAQTYDDSIDPTGWWMSEKLDGVRAYWGMDA